MLWDIIPWTNAEKSWTYVEILNHRYGDQVMTLDEDFGSITPYYLISATQAPVKAKVALDYIAVDADYDEMDKNVKTYYPNVYTASSRNAATITMNVLFDVPEDSELAFGLTAKWVKDIN